MKDQVKPSTVRQCYDCSNLNTTALNCPLCHRPTMSHTDSDDPEHYCIDCAGGPFPADTMHVLTWEEDPYTQIEDGDLMCICPLCHAKRIRDEG